MYNYNKNYIVTDKNIRKEINEKIIACINTNKIQEYGISKEMLYNSYSGKGGLHDIEAKDFSNYNEFAREKRNFEEGAFFTPHDLAERLMSMLKPSKKDVIIDPTCGSGVFCNFTPEEMNFYGNDIDKNYVLVAKYLYPNSNIMNEDLRLYNPGVKANFVVGNPPFALNLGEEKSETIFFKRAAELLQVGGIVSAIVPLSFMNNNFFCQTQINEVTRELSFLGQIKNDSKAFSVTGVENYETKIVFFQKINENENLYFEKNPYNADDIFEEETDAQYFYENRIKEAKALADKNCMKIRLLNNHKSSKFEYLVLKYLYQIKVHPATSSKYPKAIAYYDKFKSQKQGDMKYEEWIKTRITENKVISYLKRVIKNQNKPAERDIIKCVKTKYTIKIKGYSYKTKKHIKEYYKEAREIQINDLVLNQNFDMNGVLKEKGLIKLLKAKRTKYEKISIPIENRDQDKKIDQFIKMVTFYDDIKKEIIELNEIQRGDLAKLLQSPFGALQWEQGSGKTLAAITSSLFRMKVENARNSIVVGPAIAIRTTWQDTLQNYGYSYVIVDKVSDFDKIKKGDFVLVSLNMLTEHKKHFSKFMKKQSQKVNVIIDESDNIGNYNSKGTKAALCVLRRAKYKLLTSGTLNRNSIIESISQFEILYNNSINMLSECENLILINKNGENDGKSNELFMKPIPAYSKGYSLFKASHIPSKTTVLGITKHNQDIFNAKEFKNLVNKTIITRTLEEIKGEKSYYIKQDTVKFSTEEANLYSIIVKEFNKMSYLFNSTGDIKKDRYFDIIRQLNLMLKACVVPEWFSEFESTTHSTKLSYLLEEISNMQDYVAIGLTHKISVDIYSKAIIERFPNRKVFIITGDKTSIKRRLSIIQEMKKTPNSILVCTQQSLSSSVDIEFVDNIFVPELDWNYSKMSQWFMRFCRYNSVGKKQIRFITYEYSIESNLLSLIISKERITSFIKNQEEKNDELFDKFGIEFNLLDMLMEKVKNSDGKTELCWGKQEIS